MKKTFIIITAALFLVITLSGGLTLAQEEDQEIARITVEGNEHISENEILDVVETEVGDGFDEEGLRSDMQAIMDLGYFQDIQVNFKQHDGGLEVIFEVVENPMIEEINIEGNEVYDREEIVNILDVQEGDMLNVQSLNDGLKELQQKYKDDGYAMAGFRDVNISEDGQLSVKIDVGHLNEIVIKGNEKTKDFVITRELDIEPGDPVNVERIQDTYRKLYQLNYFEEIEPELKPLEDKDSNQADLVINVKEGETGQLNFGAGYSAGGDTSRGLFGYVNVREENLLGRGQTLSLSSEFSKKDTTYSLNFEEPWVMGTPTSFGISLYNQSSRGSSYLEEDGEEYSYDRDRKGGNLSLGHPLTEMWQGTVTFKAENTKINYDEEDIDDEESRVRSLGFEVDRDTTNHPFNPTEGAIDIFSSEFAGGVLGGTDQFVKLNADFRRFYPAFLDDDAWALRMKTGLGTDDIPTSDKYRLGGANTLRGYDNIFYGNNMLLGQVEYRYPIVDKITGVVFVDGGNTWDKRDEMTLNDLNYSAGLGARMNTPLGQLKLDYGWREDGGGKFHFNIGQTF
ncbi:MAG: BamA/OMP85 family outer membrane protein [Bacillota bacterium]